MSLPDVPEPPLDRPSGRRRWPRRVLIGTLAALLTLALVATGLAVWSVRRSFPEHDGELPLAGLSASVTVYRDEYGIPQVYARTATDLFAAQGYLHAQDRFWEMDVRRHVTAGRLAELFGPSQVATDAFLRTLGWRRVAEQEMSLLSAEVQAALRAYATGVNAWLAAHGDARPSGAKSLEYAVVGLTNPGLRVEPWNPVDSLAWLKAMAWDLRGNYTSELDRALLSAHGLTPQQISQLFPSYPDQRNQPIVSGGSVVAGSFVAGGSFVVDDSFHATTASTDASAATTTTYAAATATAVDADVARAVTPMLASLSQALHQLPHPLGSSGSGLGSNSWVIAGSLTATGKPLLANDPHLSPTMPGIWYQMGLHCTCEYNVEGFTFSGLPGVVIGHNERVAWGLTNLSPDVTDFYLERVDGDRVFDGSTWTALDRRDEVLTVAGGDPVTIVVRTSKHGPLLSDRSQELLVTAQLPTLHSGKTPAPSPPAAAPVPTPSLDAAAPGVPDAAQRSAYAVALRWTALDPGRSAEALFLINRSSSWSEFRAAAALFDVPAQNLVYADVDGNIGYQAPGRIPVRGKGDGTWPAPGWDPAYDWTGDVPFAELPTVLNPAEGFVVTANQAVTGPAYPHLLTRDWAYGYRSQRIRDMLRERLARGKIGAEDIRQMQFDNYNGFAPTLVPVIVQVAPSGPVQLLAGWDFQQPAEEPAAAAAAAALYNAFWRHLLARTFDEMPDNLAPSGDDRWWEVVRSLLDQPSSPWWDEVSTPGVETRDAIFLAAMRDAVAELTQRLGSRADDWRWGALHTVDLVHGTLGRSGIAPVEWLFNRGPVPVAGGSAVVNATGWAAGDGYQVNAVPSMRMIVDLSQLDSSRWVQLTGNSGHAFHANYTDQLELWRTGQNVPMRWDRASIEAAATQTLTLTPSS